MSRPLALDLFCGQGDASMGLYRAGFDAEPARTPPAYSEFIGRAALNG